jgi:hypothetical protein
MHNREIAVEHHHVVARATRTVKRSGTVVRDVYREPGIAQSLADPIGEDDVVLHDQYPHRIIVPQRR